MQKIKTFIQRHPVITYFGIAYIIPALSFLVIVLPKLIRGEGMQPTDALTLFPIMEVGVCLAGIILTGVVDGRRGLRDLFSRIGRWRVGVQWYAAAFLIPPVLMLLVLFSMRTLVSPDFTPKIFLIGILFGIPAGILEEIGWMGYAYPKMRLQRSALSAAVILGLLWGLWHAPVVDYLGGAAPHGVYWLPFFLAFIAILMALRVLIVWIYENTGSVLLAQLMHASNTSFLVILAPLHVSPAQEALWYAVYAAVLWIAVAIIVARYGKRLVRQPVEVQAV